MPEKTKPGKETGKQKGKEAEKPLAETAENDTATWGADQREKSYYYDDGHGYEVYNPDEDDDEVDKI